MNPFPLIYAPNNIFRQIAQPVQAVTKEIQATIDRMVDTLYVEGAAGIGANMIGILKRIAIVDLRGNNECNPYIFINPEITYFSEEKQIFEEASLCFPGISAEISRPKSIKLSYLDYYGDNKELEAEGFLATVIQHEVDYLNGKIFLDYLSKLKSDSLFKKMTKYIKLNPPHIHSSSCHH